MQLNPNEHLFIGGNSTGTDYDIDPEELEAIMEMMLHESPELEVRQAA